MQLKVSVRNTSGEGHDGTYFFEESTIRIGRRDTNDLPLPDVRRTVSSSHAKIEVRGGKAHIEDLDSKNGTSLNGVRLQPETSTELSSGDVALIGNYELRFDFVELGGLRAPGPADSDLGDAQTVMQTRYTRMLQPGDLRKAVAELMLLNEMAREISATTDLDAILNTIVRRSLDVLGAGQGVIHLSEEEDESGLHTLVRAKGQTMSDESLRIPQLVFEWMRLNREPLTLNTPREDTRFQGISWNPETRNALCVPLLVQNRFIGMLTLFNKRSQDGFSQEDMRLLVIIAAQSAQVIEQARLHGIEVRARELQLENEKKELELEKARELQIAYDEIRTQEQEIRQKNEENERLLLHILPGPIAERLKGGEETIADSFAEVTVLFSDLVGFTDFASRTPADRLVALLNDLISDFDRLALSLEVEKIKTIGDAYMAVAGLPDHREDHAEVMARLSLDMLTALDTFNQKHGTELKARIGLNTGPVVAGVIGMHKFIYDLWGDAVNVASRMESHGSPGRVHVSESTHARLRDKYVFEPRGVIDVKGKGPMQTYFLQPGPSLA